MCVYHHMCVCVCVCVIQAVSNSSEALEEELAEVRQEVEAQKDTIRAIFNYYSMVSGPCSK